jgi:hypothetical protein
VLRKPFFLLCLLFLAAADLSGAQAVARRDAAATPPSSRSGTWSATSSTGATLMGTWTAVPGATGRALTGTWTLFDAGGRTVAGGGWSATKAPARWAGAWRAAITGRAGGYAGTWSARLPHDKAAQFADLLDSAARAVVSGEWRAGRHSGAWSIRTAARAAAP